MEKGIRISPSFFHYIFVRQLRREYFALHWQMAVEKKMRRRRAAASEVGGHMCASSLSASPEGREEVGLPADDGCRSGQHAKPTSLFFFLLFCSLSLLRQHLGLLAVHPPFRSPHRFSAGSAGSNGSAAGTGWRGIPRLPQTKKFEACVAPLGSLSPSLSLGRKSTIPLHVG